MGEPHCFHGGPQQPHRDKMTKRTKKVGITGKYGTRYGASLRKQVKKMEVQQHARYVCTFCGKETVKRKLLVSGSARVATSPLPAEPTLSLHPPPLPPAPPSAVSGKLLRFKL